MVQTRVGVRPRNCSNSLSNTSPLGNRTRWSRSSVAPVPIVGGYRFARPFVGFWPLSRASQPPVRRCAFPRINRVGILLQISIAGMRKTRRKMRRIRGRVHGCRRWDERPAFPPPIAGLLWRAALDLREDRDDGSHCCRFRKVQAPLTIEPVEIDGPWPREVLVRTAATGFATAISMSSTGSDGSRSTARSCT